MLIFMTISEIARPVSASAILTGFEASGRYSVRGEVGNRLEAYAIFAPGLNTPTHIEAVTGRISQILRDNETALGSNTALVVQDSLMYSKDEQDSSMSTLDKTYLDLAVLVTLQAVLAMSGLRSKDLDALITEVFVAVLVLRKVNPQKQGES